MKYLLFLIFSFQVHAQTFDYFNTDIGRFYSLGDKLQCQMIYELYGKINSFYADVNLADKDLAQKSLENLSTQAAALPTMALKVSMAKRLAQRAADWAIANNQNSAKISEKAIENLTKELTEHILKDSTSAMRAKEFYPMFKKLHKNNIALAAELGDNLEIDHALDEYNNFLKKEQKLQQFLKSSSPDINDLASNLEKLKSGIQNKQSNIQKILSKNKDLVDGLFDEKSIPKTRRDLTRLASKSGRSKDLSKLRAVFSEIESVSDSIKVLDSQVSRQFVKLQSLVSNTDLSKYKTFAEAMGKMNKFSTVKKLIGEIDHLEKLKGVATSNIGRISSFLEKPLVKGALWFMERPLMTIELVFSPQSLGTEDVIQTQITNYQVAAKNVLQLSPETFREICPVNNVELSPNCQPMPGILNFRFPSKFTHNNAHLALEPNNRLMLYKTLVEYHANQYQEAMKIQDDLNQFMISPKDYTPNINPMIIDRAY